MSHSSNKAIPDIIYGTAFKFENSASLVEEALKHGFRGIDTAGSRSAYREGLVGEALKKCLDEGVVKREDLYIQTKFTPLKPGKDPKLYPYDTTTDIPTQVSQSITSSLKNLHITYIDCLILHSLAPTLEDTLAIWHQMEQHVPSTVRSLGVSNTDISTLRTIYDSSTIKPSMVQNRFTQDIAANGPNPKSPPGVPYPEDAYDKSVRDFCAEKDMTYTPWGLLWGNEKLLEEMDVLQKMGSAVGVTKEVAFYLAMMSLKGGCKMNMLCGTKKVSRMGETIEGVKRFKEWIKEGKKNEGIWEGYVEQIQRVVDA